jgi:hypothetical protein
MNTILEEVKPETAEILATQAKALGISVDELINRMLARLAEPQSEELSLSEVDRILDELAEGGENLSPLPSNFSREDIYFDHD